MGFMQGVREAVSRLVPTPPVGSDVAKSSPKAGYFSRNAGNVLASFTSPLREARQDVRAGWWRASAYTTDLAQNSGFISGMFDQFVADTIGKGLQLRLRPNPSFLNMSEDKAWDWATGVEGRWNSWCSHAYECDAEDRNTFWKMQAQQCRMYLLSGETLTSITWKKRHGSPYGTKFKVLPAYSLFDKNNGKDIIHGVKIDDFGAAKAYFFRKKSELEGLSGQDIEIARRDRLGRSQIAHVFDGAAGQLRGITPLAPVIQGVKQFDRLQDVTLQAAVMQTIFAAVIQSELPSNEILQALQVPGETNRNLSAVEQWLDVSEAWNKEFNIDLGTGARIPHLMPNEKLEFKANNHPNGQYVDFAKFLLHEIARCLGLTYYSATGDASGSNYATLNIGETKNYAMFDIRRQNIIAPMCDEVFYSWLEEDIQLGNTVFPGGQAGYLQNKYQAFTTKWRGPGKPQADDLKAAKAYEVLDNLGIMSQTSMAEERGDDIDDVYADRAREKALRDTLKLPDPVKQRVMTVEDQLLLADSNSGPATP
jgi:lambda family phage portal protein